MSEPSSTPGEPRDVVRDVSQSVSASAATPRDLSASAEADPAGPLFSFEARWVDLICTAIFPEPPRGAVPLAITSLHP